MPGRTTEVAGVQYRTAPEICGCDGCAADNSRFLCAAFPYGCAQGEGYVWIKQVHAVVPGEPFERSHGDPTGPQDAPSKAYKPVHGGYPDASPKKGLTG